jgi:hypothetical protein
MDAVTRSIGIVGVFLVGALYAIIGIVFGALATGNHVRVWRLAAWVFSIVAFIAHLAYERFHRRRAPGAAAVRVALAAGLGALGLAIAALVHARGEPNRRFPALMLVVWPLITALPAFAVAWMMAAVTARARPESSRSLR